MLSPQAPQGVPAIIILYEISKKKSRKIAYLCYLKPFSRTLIRDSSTLYNYCAYSAMSPSFLHKIFSLKVNP
jgi:hypothetical protein